jgi:hypothetical protein
MTKAQRRRVALRNLRKAHAAARRHSRRRRVHHRRRR